MKAMANSRCPCNRYFVSIPVAILNVGILILVISSLFIAATLMESKLLSNEGELVEFTQY